MTRADIFDRITQRMSEIYRAKNSDYGGAFTTIRSHYPESVVIRLWDKLLRLEQLMKPGYEQQVQDEKIEDTLLDMANYACMELVEREMDTQSQIDRYADTQPRQEKRKRYLVWALDEDGITEYFNWEDMATKLTCAELWFDHDTNLFELELELSYKFDDVDALVRHMARIDRGLSNLVYRREPNTTYRPGWADAFCGGDVISGSSIREVLEKFGLLYWNAIECMKQSQDQ